MLIADNSIICFKEGKNWEIKGVRVSKPRLRIADLSPKGKTNEVQIESEFLWDFHQILFLHFVEQSLINEGHCVLPSCLNDTLLHSCITMPMGHGTMNLKCKSKKYNAKS